MSDKQETTKTTRRINLRRFNTSCPDCGYVLAESSSLKNGFDCVRCGTHYSTEDLQHESDEKRMAQYHKHAKSNLESEEE